MCFFLSFSYFIPPPLSDLISSSFFSSFSAALLYDFLHFMSIFPTEFLHLLSSSFFPSSIFFFPTLFLLMISLSHFTFPSSCLFITNSSHLLHSDIHLPFPPLASSHLFAFLLLVIVLTSFPSILSPSYSPPSFF